MLNTSNPGLDWILAAQFWADMSRKGRQLAEIDLLVAALAYRLKVTIVSGDNDFMTLPVNRENWRLDPHTPQE